MKHYTEYIHAHRLLKMLEMEDTCMQCPLNLPNEEKYYCNKETCGLCRVFVGYSSEYNHWRFCPCYFLGPAEAIKRTWIALEEKGYLE